MSKLSFGKYEGAGNDFILIDDRALSFDLSQIPRLCRRKFGIGADGVILLQPHLSAHFRMRIFNSDGSEAESCGNGLCCLARFIADLGLWSEKCLRIATMDRMVEVEWVGDRVAVQMGSFLDVKRLYIEGHEIDFLNTGVPHAVLFVPDVQQVDFAHLGSLIRSHPSFHPKGTNVNFAALQGNGLVQVRTFERGLEGESLSCGTGAAAVAVVASQKFQLPNPIQICFAGGEIEIEVAAGSVKMMGRSAQVFEGVL